jgi:hypothetical protein
MRNVANAVIGVNKADETDGVNAVNDVDEA